MATIRVYDWQGNLRTMDYLKAKYGDFVIQPAATGSGPAYEIVALREKANTAATLVIRVSDEHGAPVDMCKVAWYWPDAPEDPDAGPLGGVLPAMRPDRAVDGLTNLNGDVGFGMGGGAFYWPSQGEIGPHAAWVYGSDTRSDIILGLGMVGGTNHDHFDVEFALMEEHLPPEPPEPPECPTEEIEAELLKIEAAIAAIRDLIG
jgi:hypothetical protein